MYDICTQLHMNAHMYTLAQTVGHLLLNGTYATLFVI